MNLLIVEEKKDAFVFEPSSDLFESLTHLSGTLVRIGVLGGPRGEARVVEKSESCVRLQVERWEEPRPAPPRVDLILGYTRPIEAQRILRQVAMMSVSSLTIVPMDLIPHGYAQSGLWVKEKIATCLREGLAQGYHTNQPEVRLEVNWRESIEVALQRDKVTVLDPYLGHTLLANSSEDPDFPGTLVIGSERGFSKREQEYLRERKGLRLRHLGGCILNTQVAVVAAVALAHRQTGFWSSAGRADLANSF